MKANFDKLNKLTLPATIIIASLILGCFYYASQINKQQSIERQQQLELEQEHKEYVAKRRLECYELYKERDQLRSNVFDYFYREQDDVCVIIYEKLDWEEGDPFGDKYFTKEY